MKKLREKYSVNIKWLVMVILYGIIPNMLLININKNIV
jgi:hypothetical protein